MGKKVSSEVAKESKNHYSKKEIEEKENKELKVKLLEKLPSCPSYLNDEQKKIYKKIGKQLINAGLLTELDIDSLVRYAVVSNQYEFMIRKSNENMELLLDKNYMSQLSKMNAELLKISKELGLTVASRSKITVVQVEKEVEENPFSGFLK